MERGRHDAYDMVTASGARGWLAAQVSGAEAVEIKATIQPRRIGKALDLFGVSLPRAEQRLITFFDTPALELFKSGLIIRARRIAGRPHDCTIKFRPVRAEDISAKWHKEPGFKIEADATGMKIVRSASLTRVAPKGLIKRIDAGDEHLKALFDATQERFVDDLASRPCDFAKLVPLGPLDAMWWKIEHPGLPWPFVAELWTRPDGAKTLEASVRVPIAQTAVASAGFLAFLAELGAAPAADQLAKTRWALDYFAKRNGKPAKKPVRTRRKSAA